MQLQAAMLQAVPNSTCARAELLFHTTTLSHRVHVTACATDNQLANAHIGTVVQCLLPAHKPALFSLWLFKISKEFLGPLKVKG